MSKSPLPQVLVQVKAYHPAEENIKSIQLFQSLVPPTASLQVSAPYTQISALASAFKGQTVIVGANEMLSAAPSSFTGSIAAKLIKAFDAQFVLIPAKGADAAEEAEGKAAREKIEAALKENITPYVCLTESWEEHHDGLSKKAMAGRLKQTIGGLPPESLKRLIIVYRADWIVTALWEANSKDLQAAYANVREALSETVPELDLAGQLFLPMPAFSPELSLLASTLKEQNQPFAGYYCGDLGPGTTQMQPLVQAPPAPPPPAREKTVSAEAKATPATTDTGEVKEAPPAKKPRSRPKAEPEAGA